MRRGLLSLIVFCLSLVLCAAILIVFQRIDQQEHVDTVEQIEAPCEKEEIGDVSDIVSIEVDAVPEDWDSDSENDGFVIYITFYDKHGGTVQFKDIEYTIRVKIFKAEVDPNGNMVKGELLHDFCCPPVRMTSSSDVSRPQGGIEIYLRLSDYAGEWGMIEVEVEIPEVGTFSAVDEEVPLSL
ncbi:MAG: hypothetical protein AYK19_12490 [Theionarchaea archaeon DG-70-1]|nr:MAG: hypothetical protein AYK19_12490 [Theionarchaea archaeon DG-70-1]